MLRVLVIDHDPLLREAMSRSLARHGDIVVIGASSGNSVDSDQDEKPPIDLIIARARDGISSPVDLFQSVQTRHPDALRVALTGWWDPTTISAFFSQAQQVIPEPASAASLQRVLSRAKAIREIVGDPHFRRICGMVTSLPQMPQTYGRLISALAKQNVSAARVAAIVETDVAIVAKVLQLANSALFGGSRSVASVAQAIVYLGFETLKALVLSVEVFEGIGAQRKHASGPLTHTTLHRHSLLVATIAASIVRNGLSDEAASRRSQEAFVAGLLHDVGKMVLARHDKDRLLATLALMREHEVPMYRAEEMLLPANPRPNKDALQDTESNAPTHAEVGAYLLGLWGLPETTVYAVATHHRFPSAGQDETPTIADRASLTVAEAVFIANLLAREEIPENGISPTIHESLRNTHFARKIDDSRIEVWKEIASAQARAFAGQA